MNEVVIEIPLPPYYCRSQQGVHPVARRAATSKYRAEVKTICLLLYKPQFQNKVQIDHFWYCGESEGERLKPGVKSHKKYRPMDEGNAIQALKPAIDGIVDSGLLIDDKAKYLMWGSFARYGTQREHQGKSCIVLVLTETDQQILPTQRITRDKKPPQPSGFTSQGELF